MNEKEIFLAQNIKYLRTRNNKSQDELAKICNKKNTAVSNWEKGIREPDAVDLGKIANFFNVSVDDLMFKDLKFDSENVTETNISEIKQKINNLNNIPEENRRTLIEMIDFFHNKVINENNKNK